MQQLHPNSPYECHSAVYLIKLNDISTKGMAERKDGVVKLFNFTLQLRSWSNIRKLNMTD